MVDNMPRTALLYLENWLNESNRKPLIIRGARQVGKTHTVRNVAERTGRQLIEFNFEKNPQHISLFASNDIKQILFNIETLFNISIDPDQYLLFLDEIQAAPELLAKLRWFAEDLPELPVVAAGSLLDFVLADHNFSMPVGRITYLYMEPLSFEEYLLAQNQTKLTEFLQSFELNQTIPEAIHQQLNQLLREYTIIGGMPAAVYAWLEKKSLPDIHRIQHDLLATYRDDFAKYAGKISSSRIEEVFTAIPKMLGNKFVYKKVNTEAQTVSMKSALHLLCQARICHQVTASVGNGIPLAAEKNDKFFKMLFIDIGLVSAMLGLNLHQFENEKNIFLVNQGGLAEQLAGQLLRCINPEYIDPELYYWLRFEKNANAEVDYLIQHQHQVLPIEVKAGATGTLKSLHLFMQLKQAPYAVRLNMDKPSVTHVENKTHAGAVANYQLYSLPLYLTGQLPRLLTIEK